MNLDLYLRHLLEAHPAADARLQDAMIYAVDGAGKHFRPKLVLGTAALFDVPPEKALPAAAALELIHCYSLVHDDLPGMDNSPLRRGKSSCWAAFDEPTAILVGDGLLTLAFESLAQADLPPAMTLKLIQKIARAAGAQGMVGGQMRDMTPKAEWTLHEIESMQNQKTGALIAVSCEAGAVLAEQPEAVETQLYEFGLLLGLIFQIVDDLLDVTSTVAVIGKPVAQDASKQTFVYRLGVEGARQKVWDLKNQAEEKLIGLPKNGQFLREMLEQRTSFCFT